MERKLEFQISFDRSFRITERNLKIRSDQCSCKIELQHALNTQIYSCKQIWMSTKIINHRTKIVRRQMVIIENIQDFKIKLIIADI